ATADPKAEEHPWHDPALPIDDRLKLAADKPLADRLMSAMAQLDCGACGYVCRTYSEAIASGGESRLTLCSPGGSGTSTALKRLLNGNAAGPNGSTKPHVVADRATLPTAAPVGSRQNPCTATVLRRVLLNKPGSEKATHHVEIELGSDVSYQVGDSLGVFPT